MDEFTEDDGSVTIGVPFLVAGRHRLEAARQLGWDSIPAVVAEGTETDFRLWEIAENLHRAELTVQERADHIAEWVRLRAEKEVLGQIAPKPQGGRPQGGIRAAAREIGIERTEVRRAQKIASITPEARAAADEAGLTTKTARLAIAAAPAPCPATASCAERRPPP